MSRIVALVLGLAVCLAAAAPASSSEDLLDLGLSEKITRPLENGCSDSHENAIVGFMRGVAEMSLKLIRLVIPVDMSPLGLFGDGDEERGRKILLRILEHRDERMNEESEISYRIMEIREGAVSGQKHVFLERTVHTLKFEGDKVSESKSARYRRSFRVTFAGKNCIVNVKSLDQGWALIEETEGDSDAVAMSLNPGRFPRRTEAP